MNRSRMNMRLWSLVRDLPGGEATMRDMVAVLRQEDGSGKELVGTDAYTSTRRLSDRQFEELLNRIADKVDPRPHRRSKGGNVRWLATKSQQRYIGYMARELAWTRTALEEFVSRQTNGKGIATHQQASAVIEPMERLLRERGFTLREEGRRKWWDPPAAIAEDPS